MTDLKWSFLCEKNTFENLGNTLAENVDDEIDTTLYASVL